MRGADSRVRPTFELETAAFGLGDGLVAGVDEAGRGPWAGPVVAAAVILDPKNLPDGVDDSKALDAPRREAAFARIADCAVAIAVGVADVPRVDRMNVLHASLWAMAQAVAALKASPSLVLIDGDKTPALDCETRAIVGGDAKCLSIAAASIVAKVTRDRMMVGLGAELPEYGFENHKGYGTPEHQAAVVRHGVTIHHRRSFRPVQLALGL